MKTCVKIVPIIKIIFLCIIMFSETLYAQSDFKIRLIYNSKQINKPQKDSLEIKNIIVSLLSNSIIVKLSNKKKVVFPGNKIWGYQDRKGIYYRFQNNQLYKVEQFDTIVIYSQQTFDGAMESSSSDYFFSKTEDSKTIGLTRKNLKKEFSENRCFCEKLDKELKWYQDYLLTEEANGKYFIIEFYKQCLNRKL